MEIIKELVSVIIPVYNVEKYVKGTILSILNQTYPNIEVILIDDGSTDCSGKICDEFLNDPRCTIIHQNNQGLSRSRNKGLSKANGEYISFIDGDDLIHPQMIEKLVNLLNDYPQTGISMISGKKTFGETPNFEPIIVNERPNIIEHNDLFRYLFDASLEKEGINFSVVWNKLYRRSLIQNITFDDSLNEDFVFNYKTYLQTNRLVYLPLELYFWLQRKNSLSHMPNFGMCIRFLLSFESCVIATPPAFHHEKSLCLRRLFKNILSSRHYLPKETKKEIMSIAERQKKELLKSDNSLVFKWSCLLFLYFPCIYSLFLNMMGLISRISK